MPFLDSLSTQWRLFIASFLLLGMVRPLCAEENADNAKKLLADAQTHLAKGRYEEAIEAYQKAAGAKADPVAIALGRSLAYESIGSWEDAEKTIDAAVAQSPKQPVLLARRAALHVVRGHLGDAEKAAEGALQLDRQNLRARLVLAAVYTETGRLREANEAYRWFIRRYNESQPNDAPSLLLIAEGSVNYARWNHNTQIFHFVVNTLCPDALKANPDAWEAHLVAGALLLEKFNREQAIPELEQALTINPRAVEAIVLMGQDALNQNDFENAEAKAKEALEINPRLPSALRLQADVCWVTGRIGPSLAAATSALTVNPRDPQSLARVAAVHLVEDGIPTLSEFENELKEPWKARESTSLPHAASFVKLWAEISQSNPKPGVFLTELGKLLEARRQFDAAEICYRRAMAVMPQLPQAKMSLGLLLMRAGKIQDARPILDDAFRADPYHARVSNFRKVLKVLNGYQAISTEHFVIRFDSKLDKLLGGYMADYLEEIYPQLVERFGFAPPQRTQFEIFNKADGTSGHEWFSARMVGLPWIQTVGASTGMMVAMASPTSASPPFNWARVLRHEFVHVITMQESHFNIPQWFTEALAVLNEGYPAPSHWNDLLADRVAKGELRTLETLDRGFQRPVNSDDWQFTYCQSRLYAEYMVARNGPNSLKKMLDAYRENTSTHRAIRAVFGIEPSEFERGYREFLNRKVAGLHNADRPPSKSVDRMEKEHREKPDDPSIAGAYAWVLLEADNPSLAKKIAKEAVKKDSHEPWASLVLARVDAEDQRYAEAIARLEPLLNRAAPHREILMTLAKLKLLDEKPREAADLCELGAKLFPSHPDFVRGLAALYAVLNDETRQAAALARLCELYPDDSAPRKKLTELALKQKRYQDAVRFGKAAMYVDVLDADSHRQLGEAHLGLKESAKALPELEAADELKPKDTEIELLLAKALIAKGRKQDAKKHLQAILERDSQNAEARSAINALK